MYEYNLMFHGAMLCVDKVQNNALDNLISCSRISIFGDGKSIILFFSDKS